MQSKFLIDSKKRKTKKKNNDIIFSVKTSKAVFNGAMKSNRLSKVDLLIKVACLVKKINKIFNRKSS